MTSYCGHLGNLGQMRVRNQPVAHGRRFQRDQLPCRSPTIYEDAAQSRGACAVLELLHTRGLVVTGAAKSGVVAVRSLPLISRILPHGSTAIA